MQPCDQETHRNGGRNGGGQTADEHLAPTKHREHGGPGLGELVDGGAAKDGYADQKREFSRPGRGEAAEVAADHGHHGTTHAGPERQALHKPDLDRLPNG